MHSEENIDMIHSYYGEIGYPHRAEKLILSDYETQTYRDSELIKGVNILNEKVLKCPRCGKESVFDVDVILECGGCRLYRYKSGDVLYIWEDINRL